MSDSSIRLCLVLESTSNTLVLMRCGLTESGEAHHCQCSRTSSASEAKARGGAGSTDVPRQQVAADTCGRDAQSLEPKRQATRQQRGSESADAGYLELESTTSGTCSLTRGGTSWQRPAVWDRIPRRGSSRVACETPVDSTADSSRARRQHADESEHG